MGALHEQPRRRLRDQHERVAQLWRVREHLQRGRWRAGVQRHGMRERLLRQHADAVQRDDVRQHDERSAELRQLREDVRGAGALHADLQRQHVRGVWRQYWVWPHPEQFIWGATAAILVRLAERLRERTG